MNPRDDQETLPTTPANDAPGQPTPEDQQTLEQPDGPPIPILATIPGYRLKPEIARGGMGIVYAAECLTFGRDVAVKVMLWRKEAGGLRPGTVVGIAEKTGAAARGTGHINVMLRLGSGDEVSTFSASADGKPRYFERIALTGYLASAIDKLAADFDTTVWEAERAEADKVPHASASP